MGIGFKELLILFVVLPLYMAPTLLAGLRAHRHNLAILMLNLSLGWTVLGWIGALVWALMDQPKEQLHVRSAAAEYKTCPHCAESIKAAAIVCRYCRRNAESLSGAS